MKSLRHLIAAGFMLGAVPAIAADTVEPRLLSGRPDMVSGGDALVELASQGASGLTISVDGKDVTASFHAAENAQTLIGHVEGLKPGKNTIEVRASGRVQAKLELTNYPIAGPIFSGPHQTPFSCQTDDFKLPVTGGSLGKPVDADCSIATRVDYVYRGADGKFKPLADPKAQPADMATTKTKDGRSVNFIVRVETGTINRSIYQTAMLHDPAKDPAPDAWHRPAGWNGRLMYNFGGGCNAGFHQGSVILAPVLTAEWLAMGFAVASATFNTWANNCNDVLSPETMMMVRERFIERHGAPVHTIGIGCSGGAMQVHLIAQNYPGLLDGIIPVCTHPDIISYFQANIADNALLQKVFENPALAGLDEKQRTAIGGYVSWDPIGKSWVSSSAGWVKPDLRGPGPAGCDPSIPDGLIYDAVKNPKGTRCTLYENMVNIFGRDSKTGFARRPLDNVGVQYGLVAFNQGKIGADQFIALNENIGGFDIDGRIVPARMVGDPKAIQIAYSTGQVMDGGGGLATTPILNVHTYAELADHHARVDGFMSRARLIAANGDADNQVMITLPGRNINAVPDEMVVKMDEWLDNLAKDPAPLSHAKIVRNKPADLVDACYTVEGNKIAETATLDGAGECNKLYPNYANPRMAAGGPVANDILKCTLTPVDTKAYAQPLNPAQLSRLKSAFPQGVCDYRTPGVDQRIAKATWHRY